MKRTSKKLSARNLPSLLVAAGTRRELYDDEIKGLVLRISPSGEGTYYVRYRSPDGRRQRIKLGSAAVLTVPQARDCARVILADVVKGEDPHAKIRDARALTLEQFLDGPYWEQVLSVRRHGKAHLARIKLAAPDLLKRKLSEVTAWNVEKQRTKRINDGVTPQTVNKDVGALKAALNKAIEWKFLKESPLATVKRLKEPHGGVVRFLSTDEEARLLAALDAREEGIRAGRDSHNAWRWECGYEELPDLRTVAYADYLKPMILLSLHTGLRRGEVFGLRWAAVNIDRAEITVQPETSKTVSGRHVPLSKTALNALTQWREQTAGTGLVFPSPNTGDRLNNVKKSWRAILEEAKITGFRWHDMRHTFASNLVMAGVDLRTVQELLGHTDPKMTARYAHLAPEHKARAVAVLDNARANVVSLSEGAISLGA